MSPAAPRDATAFEAREALGAPGCAVCRLALRSVAKLLTSIAYEQVNDIALREQLRRGGGFCNLHAHQWLAEAHSVLGTALIYRDVLQAAIRTLDKAEPNGQRSRLFGGLLGPTQQSTPCPACQAQFEAETRYLEALLAVLAADAGARQALETSDGLCRRHTLAAIRSGRDGATYVAERARAIVDALVDDLDEVIRKEDYRFRHEPRTDAERSAPARAITWAAGTPGLVED
jgi:hypothetical protein